MIRWTEPFTMSDFVIRFCLFSLPSAPTNGLQREYFLFILTSFLISFFLSVSFIVYKHNEGLLIIKCSTQSYMSLWNFCISVLKISGHTVWDLWWTKWQWSTSVFISWSSVSQLPVARYRALASIIPGRERFSWHEETTICYKISLVQWLITNLNVILYLSTYHIVYISVLILFMIMP